MKFSKLLLWVNCAVFGLYGLAFIFWPQVMSLWVVGVAPAAGSATIDVRATYGGMMLGLGLLFGLLALSTKTVQAGLQGLFIILVLMAASRGLGMWLDGGANTMMLTFLLAEVATAALAVFALRKIK